MKEVNGYALVACSATVDDDADEQTQKNALKEDLQDRTHPEAIVDVDAVRLI